MTKNNLIKEKEAGKLKTVRRDWNRRNSSKKNKKYKCHCIQKKRNTNASLCVALI